MLVLSLSYNRKEKEDIKNGIEYFNVFTFNCIFKMSPSLQQVSIITRIGKSN